MGDRNTKTGWPVRPLTTVLTLTLATATTAAGPLVSPPTLTPRVGESLTLTLDFPVESGQQPVHWNNANIAHCFLRLRGEQRTLLPLPTRDDPHHAAIVLDRPGPALLCVGVGPPETRALGDSWQRTTRCAKIVLNPRSNEKPDSETPARPPPTRNPAITAKTGQKVEILPLMDPTVLRPGDDLALRVYYEGVKVGNAEVTAFVSASCKDEQGETISAARPTDAHGTTWIRIHKPGCWLVRFVHEAGDESAPNRPPREYTAELLFDVAEGGGK